MEPVTQTHLKPAGGSSELSPSWDTAIWVTEEWVQNGEDEQSTGAAPEQRWDERKNQPGSSPRAAARDEISGCVYERLC